MAHVHFEKLPDSQESLEDLDVEEAETDNPFLEEASEARPTKKAQQQFDPHQLPEPPQGKFLQAKNWFLTFPQVTTTKEEALERLKAKLGDKILGVYIAQENHSTKGNYP